MRLCLQLLNAAEAEQTFTVDPPGGMIGRSTDSVVCLLFESVSRQHAELTYDGQSWWLHHLSQNSSTLLDDQRVTPEGGPQQLLQRGGLQLGRIALHYWQEAEVAAEPKTVLDINSEATMILSRHQLPLAVLAQLTPVKLPEAAPFEAPATMIRRAPVPPPPPLPALSPRTQTPDTVIKRPDSRTSAPATMVRTQALAQPVPQVPQVLPIAEHQLPPQPDPERARLRSERDQLAAEVERLKQDNERLRTELAAAPPAVIEVPPPTDLSTLRDKAIELLSPFGRSIEQAGEALRQGDTAQARTLLRTASFALADLRDLFQS